MGEFEPNPYVVEAARLLPSRRAHNLNAHKAPAGRAIIERRGATVKYLPPYSHDFNPIEAVWALVKKHVRTSAPHTRDALRRVIRARGTSFDGIIAA